MTRERLSTWLRWAAIVAGVCLLLVVIGARAPAGAAPSGVSVSAPGGQSSALAQTVADVAGPHISGPYTSTTKAYAFNGNVSQLPHLKEAAPPLLPEVDSGLSEAIGPPGVTDPVVQKSSGTSGPGGPSMPSPIKNFAGLDFASTAGYHPPDTNGDVGPDVYVQNVNAEIGIYTKTTGALAALPFSFNDLFASAGTGTACDANNRGDPVVLYDALTNHWLITDFAFTGTTALPGPFYECIAASVTGNPTGSWHLYALRADDDAHKWLADYPKLGVWPDGIYMSANMFDCHIDCNTGGFQGTRVWAINKANLYSGAALQSVHFDVSSVFTALPSNLRGPVPPAGTPNYFVANDQSIFALDVFKFHVNFASPGLSTFTGPTQVTVDTYGAPPLTIPEESGNALDSLYNRLMVQNQYRNISGTESLWVAHTADNTPSGLRWYQLNVTGKTIATTPVQQSTYAPDGSYRWMPSLAVDKSGNMAIGYSVSSLTMHPDIRYAGRLVTDPLSTLGQAESTLVTGGGGQTVTNRWGDYSSMTVDPVDDCTFWYTTEYYAADGGDWLTRIASFKYPSCGAVVSVNHTYLPLLENNPPPAQGWINIMREGFEGAWPSAGWTLFDNTGHAYEWARSSCHANAGSFSAWAIGGGSTGSGLSCGANYPDNAQIWMVFGPFSLAGATAAQFNAQFWLNTEVNQDAACFYASLDNNNFGGTCWSGNSSNAFLPNNLDLSNVFHVGSLLGQPNVWVAVEFRSDTSVNLSEGAFVDDLLVAKCLVASCPGQPSSPASANTGLLESHPASLVRPTH